VHHGIVLLALLIAMPAACSEAARVIMLGSGTPIPDPRSSGPAVAVVVNGRTYLFDAGAGVVRRAQEAAQKYGVQTLQAPYLNRLFLTHLHSDHTLGYPDLMLTPWIVGRSEPLEVYGPKGTAALTEHIKLAYSEDIAMRTKGLEHLPELKVNVHEIDNGLIYRDANIAVRAISACHGQWPQAFGYAIDADGRQHCDFRRYGALRRHRASVPTMRSSVA
jgi:ribonuclease Z